MQTIAELAPTLGITPTCAALNVPRSSYYRSRLPRTALKPRPKPARALTAEDQQGVLGVLHEPRFVDLAPAQVYATLLDEDRYLCSERTRYRVLAANEEVRERRNQLRHPHYAAPQLLATRPNELWSWDITRLLGPTKWTYYYLYVLLDVFSRYVVGWTVAQRELAAIAQQLIAESCRRQRIKPGQLTLHADHGAPMISKPVAFLLADLGVTKTHSRPHVSNDNPFSEAQFKTLKYRPDFPEHFGSIEHARQHGQDFFPWYNTEHHHVGLGLFTPHDVHYGLAEAKRERRAQVLAEAYALHPERFPNGCPSPRPLPTAVWINPPANHVVPSAAEFTRASESSEVANVDRGASCEAVLDVNHIESQNLTFEDHSIAVAQ